LTTDQAIGVVRSANQKIELVLAAAKGNLGSIRPYDFIGLAKELLQSKQALGQIGLETADPELRAEVTDLRIGLEQVGKVLPSLHGRLLAEKERLETARARLATTADWIRARRVTL